MPNSAARPNELRCAIYTRKSSEEGLEQDFNSLHAQREACQAYIKSQKHEGWKALSTHYDDGGYSGGTMERPALQRMLADISARRIDIIVVYKVDRLTRSLADFAKIVEVFDTNGVSFVSVTQAFNTTTSMGRLTLNVLLSFAQFEREVTGERIRDKIAASKKKGLWMGGFVPMGYRAKNRTLVIDKAEAETVRSIFARYLTLGSVLKLEAKLAGTKLRTRAFTWGNRPFSRGHLYYLLSNPIYAGKIAHKDKHYDGQHDAIIDRKTWNAVQAQLAANNRKNETQSRAKEPSLLAGLLIDSKGNRLTSSHTAKGGRRYRYYVGNRIERDQAKPWRLPAPEVEVAIIGEVQRFLQDRQRIAGALKSLRLRVRELEEALGTATDLSAVIEEFTTQRETALRLIKRVVVDDGQLVVELKLGALLLGASGPIREAIHRLTVPVEFTRQDGNAMVLAGVAGCAAAANPSLVKALACGFAWFEELATGRVETVRAIAKRERVTDRYVSQLMELALIDPRIVQRASTGVGRTAISTTRLVFNVDLPLMWPDQEGVIFSFAR